MFTLKNFVLLFKNLGHNEYKRFILDSIQVAKISSLIAKEYPILNHRNVYVLGLSHNVGHFLRDFNEILSLKSMEEIEKLSKTQIHSLASYYLLKRVRFFDEEEIESVLYHHSDFSFENKTRVIGSILKLADMIAHEFSRIETFDDYAIVLPNLWRKIERLKIPNTFKNTVIEILKDYKLIETLIDDDLHLELLESSIEIPIEIDSSVEMAKIISLMQGMRSYTTRNHISIVARVSQKIAESYLGKYDGKILKIAGYFHDIGKLKVPLKVLHKKRSLTQEEWILMRKHVVDTSEILINSGLKYLAEICAAHHERLDGSGYPFGLKGDEMFCYQRLLQVSDVYSALIENRPYRKALNYKEALNFLKSEVKRDRLDEKYVNELENLVKSDFTLQRASFEDVLEDIFEEDYKKIRHELPEVVSRLVG